MQEQSKKSQRYLHGLKSDLFLYPPSPAALLKEKKNLSTEASPPATQGEPPPPPDLSGEKVAATKTHADTSTICMYAMNRDGYRVPIAVVPNPRGNLGRGIRP